MMDWFDEIEARARDAVTNIGETFTPAVSALRDIARSDVQNLIAEVRRLREELEAAKRDLQMAGWGNVCEVCIHDKEGLSNPACDVCDDEPGTSQFVWRGVTENGGANEAD